MAFRLGVSGNRDRFSYSATLRRTEAGFANPASPGFTIGTTGDRDSVDLSLQQGLGVGMLSLQLRNVRGGGGASPDARENGGSLSYATPLAEAINLNVAADLSDASSDADAESELPASDSRDWGLSASLSEMAGGISFSQSLSHRRSSGSFMSEDGQKVSGVNLSAVGPLMEGLDVSGTLSATRTDSGPDAGTTDQTLVSLQPSWRLASLGLVVEPLLSFNRSRRDLDGSESRTEQYQLSLSWNPPRIGTYASFQLSGDWNRTRLSGEPSAGFTRRIALVITLRWEATGSVAAAPAQPTMGSSWQPSPLPPVAMAMPRRSRA
jgi:hypothetical protein